MRLSALMLFAIVRCVACDCTEPSVQVKRDHADVVFRGTIVGFRDASEYDGIPPAFARNTKKNVVFKVSRVWKGQVGEIFEMPAVEETSACVGFWPSFLRIGEDLLVYASHFGSSGYLTSICGNHKLAKHAKKDFSVLGRGREPQRSRQRPK